MKKLMRITMAAVLVVAFSGVGSFIHSNLNSNEESMFYPGGGGGTSSYSQYMTQKLGLFKNYSR